MELRDYPRNLLLLFAALAVASAQSIPPVSGTISGLVLGPDGTPVPYANISAVIVSPVPPRQRAQYAALSFVTQSIQDGTFKLANVPAGTYRICADALNRALLNTCRWGGGPSVAIGAGNAIASVPTVRLAAGATLSVHVADPTGALGKQATLAVEVSTPTGFVPLPLVGSSAASRDYQMLVPFSTDLSLMILGKSFTMTNAQGLSVDYQHQTIPVRFTAGTPAPAVNLSISGL